MDSYKFTITEAFRHTSTSSSDIIDNILKMVFHDLNKKPHKDFGVMFEENRTFPKDYYLSSSDQELIHFMINIYDAVPANYPGNFMAGTPEFKYKGNGNLFSPKL
jgi:hypothetical protein